MPTGTITQTQTVYSGTISATPLQIARDFLEGYTGDYYFFRAAEDGYILVLTDNWDMDSMSCSDCDLFLIAYDRYSGGLSTYFSYYYQDFGALTVSNPNYYLAYGSAEGLPHLVEGVENYAFAQILLLVSMCLFCFVDRVFRHIR